MAVGVRELAAARGQQGLGVKKQTAKRSINKYGKLDPTMKLVPFQEELQAWKAAIQRENESLFRGETVAWLDSTSSTLSKGGMKERAPELFIELSKPY